MQSDKDFLVKQRLQYDDNCLEQRPTALELRKKKFRSGHSTLVITSVSLTGDRLMSKRIYTLMIEVAGPKRVALEHNRRLNILEIYPVKHHTPS